MTEQLINLETAKLAKERGFSVGSENYYNLKMGDLRKAGVGNSGFDYGARPSNENNTYAIAEAPTQALLQKWLRDEHQIWITVCVNIEDKRTSYEIWQFIDGSEYFGRAVSSDWDFNSFETALEAALLEALNLLEI